MANKSIPLGTRLLANAAKLRPELSLLQHPFVRHRNRASLKYGKYRSIRIDSVTKRIGADPLTLRPSR